MPALSDISAIDCAQLFFQHALEREQSVISNVALHDYVAQTTGQTRGVIHGTLDGEVSSLAKSDWYVKNWHKETCEDGRIAHCRNTETNDAIFQREHQFDSSLRREAITRIMEHIPTTGQPRLLTFAGLTGSCIQAALQRNPATVIDNLETRPEILARWPAYKQSMGFQTRDYSYRLVDFVKLAAFRRHTYDLVNACTMGYVSRSMYEYLAPINRLQNTKTLALTIQCFDRLRNTGDFQDDLRDKYAGSNDQQAECLVDWLDNYEMIDRFVYRPYLYTVRMEVFIFSLCQGVS